MTSIIPGYKTFQAIKFLITGPMIVAMLFVINLMTSPGNWWFQWAAFGIGIAWFINLMRVLRSIVVVGGLAALGYLAYRHFTKQPTTMPLDLA